MATTMASRRKAPKTVAKQPTLSVVTEAQRRAPADPIARRISELPDEFIECRTQHIWKNSGYYAVAQRSMRNAPVVVIKACVQCGSRKRFTLTRSGEIVKKASYRYADGYQMKGIGRVNLAPFRAETLRRADITIVDDDSGIWNDDQFGE